MEDVCSRNSRWRVGHHRDRLGNPFHRFLAAMHANPEPGRFVELPNAPLWSVAPDSA